MNNCKEVFDIAEFYLCWENSISAKLLVPNPNEVKLYLGKEKGHLASIAYLACQRNTLYLLDDLFEKWKILDNGTNDFKGKLKENWLEENEERQRNISNDTLSAISELLVATYLEENSSKVIDLGAWGNNAADVVCKINNKKSYFEVKYFADSPELYELRKNAAKGTGVSVGSISNREETRNYFYYRFAEAILQLNKINVSSEFKKVFFVFAKIADMPGRSLFENSIGKYKQWYRDQNGNYPGVLEQNRDIILNKTPLQWLSEINELFIGTMEDWKLQNITNRSTLTPNGAG